MRFNVLQMMRRDDGSIVLDQREKVDKLVAPRDQKRFASMKALAQYVGVNTCPDICAPTQIIAHGSEDSTTDEFKTLSIVISTLKDTADFNVTFVKLDLSTVRLF